MYIKEGKQQWHTHAGESKLKAEEKKIVITEQGCDKNITV